MNVKLDGMIFDLDGTLADTLPVCFAAFRDVFAAHLGQTWSDAEIHALFGPSEEGIIARLVPDADAGYRDYLAAYERAHVVCGQPFTGIREALRLLAARGIPVAIVTAKGPGSAAISARVLGLDRHFATLEAGTPGGNAKPRSIRRVLDSWGVGPERVAYVGDAVQDVRASRVAGVVPIAAAWAGTADRAALLDAEPELLFESTADFTAWIERDVERA